MVQRDVEGRTVIEAIFRWADEDPEKIAIGFRGEKEWLPPLTRGDLRRQIYGAAHALEQAGIGRGDHVLLALDTGLPAVAAFLGSLTLGAVPIMTSPFLGGFSGAASYIRKLQREIDLVKASTVVVPSALAPGLGDLGTPILTSDLFGEGADAPPREIEAREDDLVTLQMTSGSTGFPRAVRVTHRNTLLDAEAIQGVGEGGPDDVMLCWIPLYHDMGLHGAFLYPLLFGFPTYLMSPAQFIRAPGLWASGIQEHRATMMIGPNFCYTLLGRVLEQRPADPEMLSSVRVTFNGAEPIQAENIEEFLRVARPHGYDPSAMMPCYGLGEVTLIVSSRKPGEGLKVDTVDHDVLVDGAAKPVEEGGAGVAGRVVSCGAIVRHVEVSIRDEEGEPLPERRVGEVVVSGPMVCRGYFQDEEATRATFGENGLRTGDLGYLADGELYLVGRKKDVLIVQGQKFAPHVVEWAAEKVEGLRNGRSAAFGVPDPEQGSERVVVACESRAPEERHGELARAAAAQVLEETGLKVRVYIFPPGTVPKTTSGKVQRRAAREQFLKWQSAQEPGA